MTAYPAPSFSEEAEPIVPFVDEQSLDAESRQLLQTAADMLGVVPNAGRTYLHRPDIAHVIHALYKTIVHSDQSTLSVALKNQLGIICSSTNNCVYCTSHQCSSAQRPQAIASRAGLTDDELLSLISGYDEGADDVERLCFEFARTASRDSGDVSIDLLERMKATLSSAQIVELGSVVAMWKFFNTMHDSLRIPSEGDLVRYSGFIEAGRGQSQ